MTGDYADRVQPFLDAIADRPDDDLPRMVFADWLEEHGRAGGEAVAALLRRGLSARHVATLFRPAHEFRIQATYRAPDLGGGLEEDRRLQVASLPVPVALPRTVVTFRPPVPYTVRRLDVFNAGPERVRVRSVAQWGVRSETFADTRVAPHTAWAFAVPIDAVTGLRVVAHVETADLAGPPTLMAVTLAFRPVPRGVPMPGPAPARPSPVG